MENTKDSHRTTGISKKSFAVVVFIFISFQIINLIFLYDGGTPEHTLRMQSADNLDVIRLQGESQVTATMSTNDLYKFRYLIKPDNSFGNATMYSALVSNSTENTVWDMIAVQGWATGYSRSDEFICCVKHRSGIVKKYTNVRTKPWLGMLKSTIVAWQHRCYLEKNSIDDLPSMVTVLPSHRGCHDNFESYLEAEFIYKDPEKLAIFAKVLYCELNPDDVIAWFEIHRAMGPDFILAYVSETLNDAAKKVVRYYQRQGLVQVHHYPLPGKADVLHRDIPQAWHFRGVSALDGIERLSGYKYVVSMDLDEYLIPTTNEKWRSTFDRMVIDHPDAAGFRFQTYLHIKSWGPQRQSVFDVGRYINRSVATDDRVKHVILPRRVQLGHVGTHNFKPAEGYERYIAPTTDIAIHHYRICREEWLEESDGLSCYKMKRIRDESVYNRLKSVETNIYRIKDLLHV